MLGPPHELNLFKGRASVVSSGLNSSRPSALAIDGVSSSCSSLIGTGKTWLRVDIQSLRLIREVHILFLEDTGAGVVILVGRSLRNNGYSDNVVCGTVSNNVTSLWNNVTCSKPVFGQFIYIESPNNSMTICEIQVFYGNVMPYHTAVIN